MRCRPVRESPTETIRYAGVLTYWIVPVGTFVHGYMGSGQVTPVYLVAGRYLGNLKVLVPLTGMTAVLACFGANALAAGRTLYAVAREGLAPGALAKTSPRSRTRGTRSCSSWPWPQ